MSIIDIAKAMNCSRKTIYRRLNTFNLEIRGKNYPKPIPKKELRELYIDKKLSMLNISKKYGCDAVTVHNRMKEYGIARRDYSDAHIQSPKYNFSGDKIEKSYMIGFRIGDLHVRKYGTKGKLLYVSCGSTKKNQIHLIKNLFSKYCKITIGRPDKKRVVRINANLNESFNFLLEKKEHIDKEILNNRKMFFSFLAGYTDAEGSIKVHKQGFSTFRIRTYDKAILSDIKKQLEIYGYNNISLTLTSKKSEKQNKDYWGVSVYRKSQLLRLYKEIFPFIKHKDRKSDILKGIKNIEYRNIKYHNRRMTEAQNVYGEGNGAFQAST